MASRYSTGADTLYSRNLSDTTQTTNSTSSSSARSSSTETVNMDYMSAVGRQALDSLLAQLAAGGTPAQRQIQEDILRTMQQTEAQRSQYTKDAAFADAEGAMQQALSRSLEQALPSILLAGEAAGTSGDAISALLAGDVATRAAESSASVGLGAAVDYGNISNQLLATQAQLADRQDPALAALIDALSVDKGSAARGTTKKTGRSGSSESSSSTTRQVQVSSGAQSGDADDVRQFNIQ